MDGSVFQPHPVIILPSGLQQPKPAYSLWLRLDQLIWSWLFATISKDHLTDVRDLQHCFPVWQWLETRFNISSLTRAIDSRHLLTNLEKFESQSMEDFLRVVKSISNSLAAIQLPVSEIDLIQYTLNAIDPDYDGIVGTLTYMPGTLTFDDVHVKLPFYEQASFVPEEA